MPSGDTSARDETAIFGGYRADGLYLFGPVGTHCALAVLIYFTHCAVTASSPEGERRQRVVYKGREAQRRSGYSLYGRPTKPATSGRRRAA